jgi:hypothetical protein
MIHDEEFEKIRKGTLLIYVNKIDAGIEYLDLNLTSMDVCPRPTCAAPTDLKIKDGTGWCTHCKTRIETFIYHLENGDLNKKNRFIKRSCIGHEKWPLFKWVYDQLGSLRDDECIRFLEGRNPEVQEERPEIPPWRWDYPDDKENAKKIKEYLKRKKLTGVNILSYYGEVYLILFQNAVINTEFGQEKMKMAFDPDNDYTIERLHNFLVLTMNQTIRSGQLRRKKPLLSDKNERALKSMDNVIWANDEDESTRHMNTLFGIIERFEVVDIKKRVRIKIWMENYTIELDTWTEKLPHPSDCYSWRVVGTRDSWDFVYGIKVSWMKDLENDQSPNRKKREKAIAEQLYNAIKKGLQKAKKRRGIVEEQNEEIYNRLSES